jgi:hypothetical protein
MANRLLYSVMLPSGTKVVSDISGRYTLDVTDVPAMPDEEYMPPMGSLIEQVQFYYTEYTTKEEFWKHEGERWSKGRDHFASQSKLLKEAVGGLIGAADSEDVKAHKIYDAVMALENTDYTRRKSAAELKELHLKEAKDAEDVWSRKSGSSDEIALLYLAMARAAGLKAHAVAVCNRNRELFNPYLLSIGQLDDVLVLITINGKETVVDPGTKFVIFGQLDWKHSMASGLRQTDKGTEFITTPGNSYKQAAEVRFADLTIAPDGSVSGSSRITITGPEATRWRQLAIENDVDEVKKQFNEQMRGLIPDGVDVEFDHFLGLDDYNSVLIGIVKISGNLGTGTGKRMFLPGVFFASHAKHPFIAVEHRSTSVDMQYADTVRDEVIYHLPAAVTVESAPADTSIPWAAHAAFGLKSVSGSGQITVARSLIRGFSVVPPADYPALREFYQKVASADQQQMVLIGQQVAKGN